MKLLTVLLFVFFFTSNANACSFNQGYEPFRTSSSYQSASIPKKTNASVISIERGFDDGNGGSCSDAGIIRVKIHDENPINRTGYKFRVVDNELFSNLFPSEPVIASALNRSENEFVFVWYDLGETHNQEMKFTLEITAVSYFGNESEPFQLLIQQASK